MKTIFSIILVLSLLLGGNAYANISGESTNADKTDIVIIKSISENVQAYRSSWRDNY